MLSYLCKEHHCHCLCLQETHRGERKERHRIHGMTLVSEHPQDKYGSAIFIRDDLKVKSISVTTSNHVEVITAELPSEQFVHRSIPQIVIRDFNSHNATHNNGVEVVQWAGVLQWEESNSLTLIHDAKLPKSLTLQDGRKVTTQTSSWHFPALITCV